MNRAVFWDKDGTLIPDLPYNVDPALITLYPQAGESMSRLRQAGYKLIIVSNQAGVAHGRFPERALNEVWKRITHLLEPYGAAPDGFYYCPHHPTGTVREYARPCECRKPEPGLLLRAARDFQLDLKASWMIGDILNDVEAGNRAGCRTILIDRGNETEWRLNVHRLPSSRSRGLATATDYILKHTYATYS